jgi:hypothetical protein
MTAQSRKGLEHEAPATMPAYFDQTDDRHDGVRSESVQDPCLPSPPQPDSTQVTVTIDREDLCTTFGVSEPAVAERLLSQLVNVLQPDPSTPLNPAAIEEALAFIRGIGPKDTTEAMTATLLAASHHAAHDCLRRAMHPGQSPGGRAMYLGLSMKATRAFAQLKQGLDIGRGKVTTQRVVVERLTVESGAQAVIAVDARQGGGG